MNKFQIWYTKYYNEITWFIIGVCFMSCLDNLAIHNYGGAAIDAFFVVVNYKLWGRI
jgi:hypothetical protein